MTLFRWRDFAPNTKLPATWTDGIENVLGNYASLNFVIDQPSATSMRVKGGTAHDARVLAIQGKPRWTEADLSATVSGGAGTIVLYAVSTAESFGSAAGPPVQETDTTTRTFTLKANGTPSGSGGEAISRAIANIQWDGAKILSWTSLVGPGLVSEGKAIVPATETTASAAYALLGTPDRVQNVVMPSGGLLEIQAQSLWKVDVSGAARAALFIGANQLKVGENDGAPKTQAAAGFGDKYRNLHTAPFGLISYDASAVDTTDVATGQAVGSLALAWSPEIGGTVRTIGSGAFGATSAAGANVPFGGPCYVFVDPGVYDVSIQYKTTSGTVSVKNRKLWVKAHPFA